MSSLVCVLAMLAMEMERARRMDCWGTSFIVPRWSRFVNDTVVDDASKTESVL